MVTGKKISLKNIGLIIIGLVAINFASHFYFKRFDLTHDKRYTLSPTSIMIGQKVKSPLVIDIYLEGEFPPELKRLQTETKQLLEEFKAFNPNIVYRFINPLEDEQKSDYVIKTLSEEGITPINITLVDKGKQSQALIFPWATATYNNLTVKIPLLKTKLGDSSEQNVINSVQNLEYVFAEAFNKLTQPKQKKIAVLRGNGQLHDIFIADLLRSIRDSYFLAPFTLDSVEKNPIKTLEHLKKYDLAIIAKPTQAFSDKEKQVLDQFITNGGKTLWMIDAVNIEIDSLYNDAGTTLAFPQDLNTNDLFFKYGVRINPVMVKDIMCAPISLATGKQGNATQYSQFPWFYYPLVYQSVEHPIVNNIESVKMQFCNGIDTLKNGIKKTVLLQSSIYSKKVGTPKEVALSMVNERPNQAEFTGSGSIPIGVLLEGKFTSAFKNRVLPFEDKAFATEGKPNKMIVIADGDIIKNQLDKNFQPLELGFDKWTNMTFGNKDFIINSINYLLDDNGLIYIRNKKVNLPTLDKERIYENYNTLQIINVGLPLLLLLIFGGIFTYWRHKKFSR